MTCLKCTTDNEYGRRFFRECGELMVTACQKCGFANAVNDKYCGGCGMQLAAQEDTADHETLSSISIIGHGTAYSDADMEELISEQSESKKKRKKDKKTPAVSQDVLDNIFDSGTADSGEKED